MNMKSKLLTVLLMALTSFASAQVDYPITFDFGTDEDKTTYQNAGFTAGAQSDTTISNEPDSVRFAATATRTGGITRKFTGLGGGKRRDFTITAQFTLTDFYSWTGNGRPASIVLFANGSSANNLNNAGLAVQIHTVNSFGNEELRIASGIDGTTLASTTWRGDDDAGDPYALRDGDVMEWKVDVSFSGIDDMLVTATLSRLDGTRTRESDVERSATISFSTDNASTYIGGEYFGFGGRFANNYTTDLDTFAVDVPNRATVIYLSSQRTHQTEPHQPNL